MKKAMLVSFVAIAVMGMMSNTAKGSDGALKDQPPIENTYVNFSIVNSTEAPVYLSLGSGNAGAQFNGGGYTRTLQPGQSATAEGICPKKGYGYDQTYQNISYYFPCGETIAQQFSVDPNTAIQTQADCADAQNTSDNWFSVSAGTWVSDTIVNLNVGDELAQWMGLHGIAEKLVGGLINYFMEKEGYNPDIGTDEELNYSVTIGQRNYNLANSVGAAFFSTNPPNVTLVAKQQVNNYSSQIEEWTVAQNMSNNATVSAFYDILGYGNAYALVGTDAGEVYLYTTGNNHTPQLLSYQHFSKKQVVQLSLDDCSSYYYQGVFRYVAALNDSSVVFFDGTTAHQIAAPGWNSGILQMSVAWPDWATGNPAVVVGLADGAVIYYNGSSWRNLQTANSWGTSVLQLVPSWGGDQGTDLGELVVGLGDGAVEWWNGTAWTELHDTSWANPVYQLFANFEEDGSQPGVVVSLFGGSINYLPAGSGSSWTTLNEGNGYPCIMDVHFSVDTNTSLTHPVIVAGFSSGRVHQYQAGNWHTIAQGDGPIQFISADWTAFNDNYDVYQALPVVFYDGSNFFYNTWQYPAIPSADSLCGDLDGDGQDDLISVQDSKWYAWFSSSQYLVRGGPYETGVYGTPVTANIDGDIPDDLISVVGKNWYVWPSSSGYTQRIGPIDFGIYGKPLTGDIDGDGQKDIIMVMGSLWYVWPSSSGYSVRTGPFDLGIRGLPATGDIDGDGLADLVSVVGSDWYVWFSTAQYLVRGGPYNMGVSGAPAMGDLDGDGLADLIVVVGSDWYVWFSTSQYTVRGGPYTLSVL